eukprot:g6057.t1
MSAAKRSGNTGQQSSQQGHTNQSQHTFSPQRGRQPLRVRPRARIPRFRRLIRPSPDSPRRLQLVPPDKTLVVFDFDCTLSAVHLFHTLRRPDGQQSYLSDPSAFFLKIWGGLERIESLQRMFRNLQEKKFSIIILSFGNEKEIIAALKFARLFDFVDGIFGNASYAKEGVTSIAHAKVQMLDCFQEKTKCERIFFSDDDRNNFPDTKGGSAPFDCFAMDTSEKNSSKQRSANSSFPIDRELRAGEIELITFPAGECNGGIGLSVSDCIEIEEYLLLNSGAVSSTSSFAAAVPPLPQSSSFESKGSTTKDEHFAQNRGNKLNQQQQQQHRGDGQLLSGTRQNGIMGTGAGAAMFTRTTIPAGGIETNINEETQGGGDRTYSRVREANYETGLQGGGDYQGERPSAGGGGSAQSTAEESSQSERRRFNFVGQQDSTVQQAGQIRTENSAELVEAKYETVQYKTSGSGSGSGER